MHTANGFFPVFQFPNLRRSLQSLVAAVVLILCIPVFTGCTASQKQTTLQIITTVNSRLPEVVAAADTAAQVVASLDPASALLIEPADAAFDTLAKTLQALLTAYIANPSATALQQIQTAINTLESNVNTSVLAAAGIKNSASQALALAALKGLLTVVTIVFALISQTESVAMLEELRRTNTIHFAKVRKYMDENELQVAANETGMNLNASFHQAESFGF